jgi:LEA14-like dessication related protein
MKQILLLVSILVQLFLATSCTTLNQVGQVLEGQKPTASVKGLRLTGLDLNGVNLVFDVGVDNPNPVSISLASLDYDLKLQGSSFLRGDQPMGMQLAAKGNSQVQVPVRLGFQQLHNSYARLKNAREVGYELDMGMGFEVPLLGRIKIPVNYKGKVPIPEIPSVSLRSIDVRQLTLSGATLQLELEVDNPNAFTLMLDKLDYNLKLNGFNLGSGVVNKGMQVQQNGRGRVSLPLKFNFAQAGKGLYSVLLGQRVNYNLSGSMQASSSNPVLKSFHIPLDKQGKVDLN